MSESNEGQEDGRSSSPTASQVSEPSSAIDVDDEDVADAIRNLDADLDALKRALAAAALSAAEQRALFESLAGRVQDVLAETDGGHRAINTSSGETITPLDPDPDAIDLEDIAHALSNLSRFAGQGTRFYSVARHAVHVSHEVEARGGSLAAQRWGLLHDASEAYFADVPAPVKASLPGYTHAEKRFQNAVRVAFDLDLSPADVELVDAVDADLAGYELATYFPSGEFEAPELSFDPALLDADADAKTPFVSRARELGLD